MSASQEKISALTKKLTLAEKILGTVGKLRLEKEEEIEREKEAGRTGVVVPQSGGFNIINDTKEVTQALLHKELLAFNDLLLNPNSALEPIIESVNAVVALRRSARL